MSGGMAMIKVHNKYYYEGYARAVLVELQQFNAEKLICTDQPDLQDAVNNVGIEVVRDIFPDDEANTQFWAHYQDSDYSSIPKERITNYENRGGILEVTDEKLIGGSFPQRDNNPENLINTIRKKTVEKLNGGKYKLFKSNMLFVFTETVSLYDSYIKTVMETANHIPVPMHFDHLFLFGETDGAIQLCCCDQKALTYQRISVSSDIREKCDLAGEAYEKKKSQ